MIFSDLVVDAKGREVRPEGATGDLLTASNQVGLRKQQLSWDDICKKAAKVVSFIDLAGHERYLKVGVCLVAEFYRNLTGFLHDFLFEFYRQLSSA
jgi:hypothetical protein